MWWYRFEMHGGCISMTIDIYVIVNAFESAIPNLFPTLVKSHFNFSDDTEPGNFISQYSVRI